MIDFRPVGYVIGLLLLALGASMALPMLADIMQGNGHWPVFFESGMITLLVGMCLALSCSNAVRDRLSLQQTFLLTTTVWVALPIFAALPFMLGATEVSYTDAFFEAMSGLTTTGSTVLTGLDTLPRGLLLWRGMLQWFGGIGIIVVAMVFLPELRVGGMQIFRSEAFDTMGKVLPRAAEIASQISTIYIGITLACALAYSAGGMGPFDAVVHAMTTVSTGGFANYDASFAQFSGGLEYVATVFMLAAALPFVLYVQLLNGNGRPLIHNSQVRAFLGVAAALTLVIALVLMVRASFPAEQAMREALFNIASILTGTGYTSVDYMNWGAFVIGLFFFMGLIGGCAGSTSCSIKIFRYQILLAAIKAQIRRVHSPHGIFMARYDGRTVTEDVLSSVMAFFVLFIVTLGVFAVALAMTGLDFLTSVSGAATAVANIGPGLGPVIGPSGNFAPLNDVAKWLLSAAMLIGRLELVVVYVLFTARFWRG
ncbi:TrkH family potassium uptake protein [Jannaschia seohaensis]|uniref:Trk system potassium uptake protein n=1 Tax=Jannaschia seohaensis TaxID=475081 RepID=A0A2Y9AB03_9RHOB|nr:TrkH family potassium uptake protein [Jannaschia seohaensis]PWJ21050.1 trk system potassium uptake protein TrkH [Jannaschia seohaensis]SSA41460.1 trk system potassium uptake protein TrkH [Jannaschia seohaensis]